MSQQPKLRVHVEFGEAKADLEGGADEVFDMFVRFMTKIYPNLKLVQKLVFTPDFSELSEKLIGLIELTDEGPILISGRKLSSRKTICLTLLSAYVGNKLGKLCRSTLSTNEISRIIGKARKTVMNEVPWLISKGYVRKTKQGEYLITELGIRQTEKIIEDYRKNLKRD